MKPESVRGLLEGRKTQTRRIVKPQPLPELDHGRWVDGVYRWERVYGPEVSMVSEVRAPYLPGDLLWVRETWKPEELGDLTDGIRYRADDQFVPISEQSADVELWIDCYHGRAGCVGQRPPRKARWRSPIHLPRRFARIELDVVAVRPERLASITEADAMAEGCQPIHATLTGLPPSSARAASGGGGAVSARELYVAAWDCINGKRGYPFASNPWVWVIEFRVTGYRGMGLGRP